MKDKIKKYLLKQKEIVLKAESSTGSIYFKLNDIIVRLSDHINPISNDPEKLNIIVSADNQGCIIILGNRILQFDKYEKVREWLKFYIKSSYCLKLIPKIVTKQVEREIEKEVVKEIPVYKEVCTQNPEHLEILNLLRQIHPDYYDSVRKTIKSLITSSKSVSYVNSHIGNKYTRNGVDFDLTGLTRAQRLQVIGTNCTTDKLKKMINKYIKDNKVKALYHVDD